MKRSVFLSFLVCLLGISFAFCGDRPSDPIRCTLFDFETEEEKAQWEVRDLTQLEITGEWSHKGKKSAAITFHAWEKGREQWPAVVARLSRNALAASDFSLFDSLRFAARNPQSKAVVIKIHLRDQSQKRYSKIFNLSPGTTEQLSLSLDTVGQSLDLSKMEELHFYVTEPSSTYTVYVDDVGLSVDLRAPLLKLKADFTELAEEVSSLWERVGDGASPAIAAEVRTLLELKEKVERLSEILESEVVEDWNEVNDLRKETSELAEGCMDSRGVLCCLRALDYAQKTGAEGFVTAIESSMQKVFLEASRLEAPLGDTIRMKAARNERESAQVVILPFEGDLKEVHWELEPPRGALGAQIPATVRLVGYVDCKAPSYSVSHTGWWPDPLIEMIQSVSKVPRGEVLPLWVSVDVPASAPAGTYIGSLSIAAEGIPSQEVELQLEVWDFELPEHTHLRTALSFRSLSSRLYPEEKLKKMTRKYEDWMLEQHYLNPGNIYSGGPPEWDEDRLRALVKQGLNAVNLAYFNAPREPHFDEAGYWKSYEEKVRRIEDYLPVVEAAGARDLCYIYCFDERPSSQLDVVFETARRLKARWPDIEIMTTAYDRNFGLDREDGKYVDIWVPLTPYFDQNADKIKEARQAGRSIWWYICISPKYPFANWFVEYPAIEARLIMGAMTAKYEPEGFLYYAVNRWPLNDRVIQAGPRTQWNPASYKINNGDGSVMCAGPEGPLSTIRLENIRDGIEDYECYLLLRDLLDDVGEGRRGKEGRWEGLLPQVVGLFSPKGKSATKGLVPEEVVKDLTHFTHDPQVVEGERARLAEEILRFQ